MKNGAPESSLEEVRKQLQSFGYLNGRIERFYLSSLSRTASQFLNRCLLSLRIGLLIGTLAAVLMTAGTVIFNTGLLNQPFDLFLLFLYFEAFFVFLFSALELLLIFAVSVWIRYAGGRRLVIAGQIVSFLIGIAFFAYFFYWGRSQYEYLRLLSPAFLITMFIVLVLSCIFVAKCSWLGFLAAFHELEVGRALPNWRRHGLEVMLTLAALLMLIPFASAHKPKPDSFGPVAVLTTPDKWIVIGIDGLPLDVLRKFEASGDAPALSGIAAASYRATLATEEPVVPPVTWTTIATGVPPGEHGILMPEVRRFGGLSSWMQMTPLELAMHSILIDVGFGQRQPVSGYMRKSRAFWEILSDSGIRCGVVNWWGSWPARSIRGWNVSERYVYKVLSNGQPQDETFPAGLFQSYFSTPKFQPTGPEIDHFYMNIFQKQLAQDPVRVAAVYLPGLDILNHEFFEKKSTDPFSYADSYRKHVQWLDARIAELQTAHPDFHFLLILHRGRSLTSSQSGVLVHVSGSNRTISQIVPETAIVPLLLQACGLPIGSSMSVDLIRAIDPTAAIRTVASYPKKEEQIESAHADQFNDVLVEQMKSLGYLQ